MSTQGRTPREHVIGIEDEILVWFQITKTGRGYDRRGRDLLIIEQRGRKLPTSLGES
jgi:hypothetical protein